MDIGAELTLQIARFAQDRSDAPRSAARWFLLPGSTPLTWAEARDALAALPKPVLVAPLSEPGLLGVWLPGFLDEERRRWLHAQRANATEYWQAKLSVCGVAIVAPARLGLSAARVSRGVRGVLVLRCRA